MRKTSSSSPPNELGELNDAALTDEQEGTTWKDKDPKAMAKEVVDSLNQSLKEELDKIDLTKFKK